MESKIFYDLDDMEVVLWSSRGENKESSKRKSFVGIMELSYKFGLSILLIFVGIMLMRSGANYKYWGTLFGAALFFALIFLPSALYKTPDNELIYYLTDRRIIILKETDKYRIVRSQNVANVEKIEMKMQSDGKYALFFSPNSNVDIYEVDYKKGNEKRQIAANAPMTFLSAENIKDFLAIIKMQKDIDIQY